MSPTTYKDSGVDLEQYEKAMQSLPKLMHRTFSPRVMRNSTILIRRWANEDRRNHRPIGTIPVTTPPYSCAKRCGKGEATVCRDWGDQCQPKSHSCNRPVSQSTIATRRTENYEPNDV